MPPHTRPSRFLFLVMLAALPHTARLAFADIVYDMVQVGNAANSNAITGHGSVAYNFHIGKFEVTIGQYAAFLNSVAKADPYGLYDPRMETEINHGGIVRTGDIGQYVYTISGPSGATPSGADSPADRPIVHVSWWDTARFANWMANGQPTGDETSSTTEDGAYHVADRTYGIAVPRNFTNPNTGRTPTFYIPTENEWYKAAYYSPTLNGGTGGYYHYATQSDIAPGNEAGPIPDQANWYDGTYSVTQSATYSADQNYLTNVGAFTNSSSYFGTFDQSGNVWEWNDLDGLPSAYRQLRGGGYDNTASTIISRIGERGYATSFDDGGGIRLAWRQSSAVPEIEPAGLSSVLALITGMLGLLERRKRGAL